MLYPFKFKPLYKRYLWGGRNLEKFGKVLPEGRVAESWEISCHSAGISIIDNGDFEGLSLTGILSIFRSKVIGKELSGQFPLMVKLIDANDKLSVQVHPDDEYAHIHENGEMGKSEMWYIISAKPGAKLVYDVLPGLNKASFMQAISTNRVENCLKYLEVFPGDVIYIPAGLVHAIGDGIVLAEIQQSSNTTYRLYDYDRVDKYGFKRPLHIEKALEVIKFGSKNGKEKEPGLEVAIGNDCAKRIVIANQYFSVEVLDIDGYINEFADGSRFYIYVFTEGTGKIFCKECAIKVKGGESVLIPASLGNYSISGRFKALKSYVPDIEENIVLPLRKAGYSYEEIYENVAGLEELKDAALLSF